MGSKQASASVRAKQRGSGVCTWPGNKRAGKQRERNADSAHLNASLFESSQRHRTAAGIKSAVR